ncbi:interleukin-17 receptor E-like protein [Tiliqua scincoides]|uniref:interleukin-17 receptor E-like protein n=1 Tax=Tiliqua scincoides TaxID=71010 RepID=UPI00346370DF
MEICSLLMDTQKSQCVNVKISRDTHVKLAGRKVKVQFNCFEVNAGQHVHVTMRTIPNYCGVNLSQAYYVEAGKMTYDVITARKTILVNISNTDQDTDYYVRLCHQWFVCEDVAPVTLAWPAVSDARRMQLCPFKNDTQALWDNIIYNSITQTLAWEASCPVHVTVSLCQRLETMGPCEDLQNTSYTAVEKLMSFYVRRTGFFLAIVCLVPSFPALSRCQECDSACCMK